MDWSHLWHAFIFYLITVVARFIGIGVFYPLLKCLGYGLDFKQYLVLSYSGFKGSHGLFLALVVGHDGGFPDGLSELIVGFIGFSAFFSLTI